LPGGKAALFNVSTNYASYDEAGIAIISLKEFYLFIRLSPDGGRLAFMLSQGSSTDLWT
jgi:hypothetical protein